MRSRGYWSLLLAATLWAMSVGRDASAFDVWVETVDWMPTSSVVSVPSYYATSYLAPTSYVVPTVYATAYATERLALTPTSYVVPTYYETRFRRSLFGNRWIPTGGRTYYATSYLPTTLYYPSSYVVPTGYTTTTRIIDSNLVATAYIPSSSACCGDAVPVPTMTTRVVAPERERTVQSRVRSEAEPVRQTPAPRQAPAARSEAAYDDDEPMLPSTVEPVAPNARPRNTRPTPVDSTPKAIESTPAQPEGSASPPDPQTPERQSSPVRPQSDSVDDAETPVAPVDEFDDLLPAPSSNDLSLLRRNALRPVLPSERVIDPKTRNILFGRVRERGTDEPEEGVRVLLSSRSGAFADRTTMSDAFGRFAVRIPDGDWTVKVAMPSGRVYAVSEITVSSGLITDDEGRDVPSLTITR